MTALAMYITLPRYAVIFLYLGRTTLVHIHNSSFYWLINSFTLWNRPTGSCASRTDTLAWTLYKCIFIVFLRILFLSTSFFSGLRRYLQPVKPLFKVVISTYQVVSFCFSSAWSFSLTSPTRGNKRWEVDVKNDEVMIFSS